MTILSSWIPGKIHMSGVIWSEIPIRFFPHFCWSWGKRRAGELDWGYQSDHPTIISPARLHIFPMTGVFYIFHVFYIFYISNERCLLYFLYFRIRIRITLFHPPGFIYFQWVESFIYPWVTSPRTKRLSHVCHLLCNLCQLTNHLLSRYSQSFYILKISIFHLQSRFHLVMSTNASFFLIVANICLQIPHRYFSNSFPLAHCLAHFSFDLYLYLLVGNFFIWFVANRGCYCPHVFQIILQHGKPFWSPLFSSKTRL